MGCFSANLGVKHAFFAKLIKAMLAIEIAFRKGWRSLWLECDSMLVVQAFSSNSVAVP